MQTFMLCRIDEDCGFDEANSMIVRAHTEEDAREFASRAARDEGAGVWLDPNLTNCLDIDGFPDGVVLVQTLDG